MHAVASGLDVWPSNWANSGGGGGNSIGVDWSESSLSLSSSLISESSLTIGLLVFDEVDTSMFELWRWSMASGVDDGCAGDGRRSTSASSFLIVTLTWIVVVVIDVLIVVSEVLVSMCLSLESSTSWHNYSLTIFSLSLSPLLIRHCFKLHICFHLFEYQKCDQWDILSRYTTHADKNQVSIFFDQSSFRPDSSSTNLFLV